MRTLRALVEREAFEIPSLALDAFHSRVRERLHLEFFLAHGRLILTPHLAPLTTAEATAEEREQVRTILAEELESLEQLKLYLLYSLSLHSALLETNSHHIAINDHRLISRLLAHGPDACEVKIYTQPPGDPVERYGDRIYLGRDWLPLGSLRRPHLGLGSLRQSVPEQVAKLRLRLERHARPAERAALEREFLADLSELADEFAHKADQILRSYPPEITSQSLGREALLDASRDFRDAKHVLVEAETTAHELEQRLLAAGSEAARYATKLRKDLINAIHYIMVKVNGRISDAVNGIHI